MPRIVLLRPDAPYRIISLGESPRRPFKPVVGLSGAFDFPLIAHYRFFVTAHLFMPDHVRLLIRVSNSLESFMNLLRRPALIPILMFAAISFAQQSAPAPEAPKDMITRIFFGEFSERPALPPRWFDGGQSYTAMEPAADGHGRDLVKYDTATGKIREVLITAAQL